jgi:hypothetical protein
VAALEDWRMYRCSRCQKPVGATPVNALSAG